MQVVFRFRGAEEIVVSNDQSGVIVDFKRGIEDHGDGTSYVREGWMECLSKSQARSLASAIMGAAAEL